VPDPPPELRWGSSLKNRASGAWGEELALRYLRRLGYTLVERNYRTRLGELDLIVRKGTTLVFVEVKLRRGTAFGDPLEAVTPHKQAKIRSLAELYLLDREPAFDTVRLDVVGILLGKGPPRVRHIEDAF
jgi:putative endonuclease